MLFVASVGHDSSTGRSSSGRWAYAPTDDACTMAGTRAALEGVLKRFGPQELEAKLASKSVLDSVLPMNRKAKLWELYLQHYESIRDEAQEDFHTLFGRAFLAAYEQQLERLRREKPAAQK